MLLTYGEAIAGHPELPAVGVDAVAGDELPQRQGRGPGELKASRGPEGRTAPTQEGRHAGVIQNIPGQEPLSGEHVQCVRLQALLDQLGEKSLAALPNGPLVLVEQAPALDLHELMARLYRPDEAAVEPGDDLLEPLGHLLKRCPQPFRGDLRRVGLRPVGEDTLNGLHELGFVASQLLGQNSRDFGRLRAVVPPIPEEIRVDVGREDELESLPQRSGFLRSPLGLELLKEAEQFRNDHRVDVLADQDGISEVEAGSGDSAFQQSKRVLEEVAIVEATTAVGVDHGHALTAATPARPLPVVARLRGDVAHQDHVKRADVHPQLQGGRRHQGVDPPLGLLELLLEDLALGSGHLGGVLPRADHHKGPL